MKEKIILNQEYLIKDITYILKSAPLNFFFGKEVFFTSGLTMSKSILFQMIGNLGAFANDYVLDNSINVFVMSDKLFDQLGTGSKDEILILLEKKLNAKGQPFKDLLIITESTLIDFVKKRTSYYGDKVTQDLINSL